jgi:hypothetical protein
LLNEKRRKRKPHAKIAKGGNRCKLTSTDGHKLALAMKAIAAAKAAAKE